MCILYSILHVHCILYCIVCYTLMYLSRFPPNFMVFPANQSLKHTHTASRTPFRRGLCASPELPGCSGGAFLEGPGPPVSSARLHIPSHLRLRKQRTGRANAWRTKWWCGQLWDAGRLAWYHCRDWSCEAKLRWNMVMVISGWPWLCYFWEW